MKAVNDRTGAKKEERFKKSVGEQVHDPRCDAADA